MKKLLLGLLLGLVCSLPASIYACTITFINDLNYPVTLIFDDQTSMRVNAQDQTTFGDPDALASFIVLKRVGQKTNKYRLTQVSCAPTHQIDIYASAIGQSPIEYFEVSKNLNAAAAGGCGCGHKDRPR
jgi:hypothetical protein